MESLVFDLSIDDLIEFHTVAESLNMHQITESGDNWLVVLDDEIGIEKIFRWSIFVSKAVGEILDRNEFQHQIRLLSLLIQERFSIVGLSLSRWDSVFFYLGMIYTYAKQIGFVKITHQTTTSRLQVLSLIDDSIKDSIKWNKNGEILFINPSKEQNPISSAEYLIDLGLIKIDNIDIYTTSYVNIPDKFIEISKITIHTVKNLAERISIDNHLLPNLTIIHY